MITFTPQIDPASQTPPFRQLHDAVIAAIAGGELVPGAQLPTVRALASELGLATNTVASAYRSLEASGVVEGRGRAGTFVCFEANPLDAQARRIAADAVASLTRIGVARERAITLIGEAYDAAPRG